MAFRVFVDGQEGTTGLQIDALLANCPAVEVLKINPEKKKDTTEREKLINAADVVFLCLPDDAARESVALCTHPTTCLIDASTAHRTHPDWVFGLPELCPQQRDKIKNSNRISNPGCHATAFILAIKPLLASGLLQKNAHLATQSLTGYSGGGKKMIADYAQNPLPCPLTSPRPYALHLNHKHLPEMQHYTGLDTAPIFQPVVGAWYKGLVLSIFLSPTQCRQGTTAAEIHRCLQDYYRKEPFIRVLPFDAPSCAEEGFFSVQANNDSNFVDLALFGNDTQMILMARLDNLGKGASGAAIQSMNIHLGLPENAGLL